MIDSHTHINSISTPNIESTIDLINKDVNISSVINIGLNISTSKEIVDISKTNKKIKCSIGIHPLYIENEEPEELYNLVTNDVVAIGEIGLDTTKPNLEEQKKYLIKQIVIANELKLPVIIHANNTNKEIIHIFETIVKPLYGCVFHCFQPDLETLKYLMDNNYYISFAGRITYTTAKKSIEVLHAVDKDKFLIETDAPYLSIETRRNEPGKTAYLPVIASTIAHELNMDLSDIDKITTENTLRLFKRI